MSADLTLLDRAATYRHAKTMPYKDGALLALWFLTNVWRSIMRLPVLATLVALSLSSAASAATLIGATTISITNALSTYLQVAEVVATDSTFTNVAAAANGGSASATDMYAPQTGAAKAIDLDFNGNYYGTNSIYHGAGPGGSTLTISFAASDLRGLTIYGRTDGGFGARDVYNVTISGANGVLYTGSINAQSGSGTVSFVPEPAAWALMIGGFTMIGVASRRRRTIVAA